MGREKAAHVHARPVSLLTIRPPFRPKLSAQTLRRFIELSCTRRYARCPKASAVLANPDVRHRRVS